jgi:hypothetical protein
MATLGNFGGFAGAVSGCATDSPVIEADAAPLAPPGARFASYNRYQIHRLRLRILGCWQVSRGKECYAFRWANARGVDRLRASFFGNTSIRVTQMNRLLFGAAAVAMLLAVAQAADAQVYQVYYPPTPVTTYYAPAPVAVAPGPAVVYPTAVPVTRYRPLLGGTVTRWRYVNRPAYVYPSTVAYYPAW